MPTRTTELLLLEEVVCVDVSELVRQLEAVDLAAADVEGVRTFLSTLR